MRVPFVLLHVVVFRALIARGRRRLAIVPGVVLLLLALRYYQRQQYLWPVVAKQLFATFQTYGLASAWTILVGWFRQLLNIFGLITMETPLWFLGIHLLGRIVSILIRKYDAQTVFHRWRRVSGGLLAAYGVTLSGRSVLPDLISGRIAVTMAVYAFIVFVLRPLGYQIPRRIAALLFIFVQLTVLLYVIHRSDQFSVRMVLGGQIYLGVLYRMINTVHTDIVRSGIVEDEKDDLLYAILRGERLHRRGEPVSSVSVFTALLEQIREELKPLLKTLPGWVFTVLGGLNMVAILIQLVLFISQGTAASGREMEIAFRSSVAVYIVNYSLLQQQRISTRWQRLVVFLLINFGIYLTIYHVVWSVPLYLVGCGIIRSLLNAVVMIQARQGGNRLGLADQDYRYRLVGNMVAVVINTYFIFLLPVSIQLRFTLAAMYLALQFLLLKYQVEGLGAENEMKSD